MRILRILHFYRHTLHIIFTLKVESLLSCELRVSSKDWSLHTASFFTPEIQARHSHISFPVICSANLYFASTPIFRTSKKQPEIKLRTKPEQTMEPPSRSRAFLPPARVTLWNHLGWAQCRCCSWKTWARIPSLGRTSWDRGSVKIIFILNVKQRRDGAGFARWGKRAPRDKPKIIANTHAFPEENYLDRATKLH